jgi:hypothetical protein
MVKKSSSGSGYNVVHCHGSDKGKAINKHPMTKAKAEKMHRAIEANKRKGAK